MPHNLNVDHGGSHVTVERQSGCQKLLYSDTSNGNGNGCMEVQHSLAAVQDSKNPEGRG